MDIEFNSSKLRKDCSDYKLLTKSYGQITAKKLIKVLDALKAAECLNDISPFPPFRRHKLEGDLKNCFAIDLDHPNRVIIKPLIAGELDITLIAEIKHVKIMEVSKHYD
jgi:toxin HigB-1